MGIRNFAFITDNDVFSVFRINDEDSSSFPIIAGMRSNPIIVEVDNDMVEAGWKFIDGEFYMPARFLTATPEPDYEVDDD